MNRVALKMLFGDPSKYLGLVLGMAFSVLLVNQQAGIMINVIGRLASMIADVPAATIWVMDPGVPNTDTIVPMRDTELARVRSADGVLWAVPMLKATGTIHTPSGLVTAVTYYGVDDATLVGVPQDVVMGHLDDLKLADAVAIDADGYQKIWPGEPLQLGRVLEMNDHRARLVAIVRVAPPFTTIPQIYTRYSNGLNYVDSRRHYLSFILASHLPGRDPALVARNISRSTSLAAWTSTEYRDRTITWAYQKTALPFNFLLIIAMGVLVGALVVGLLFHLFITENLKQYAVIKAMGVKNSRIVLMVLVQAFVAGLAGYCIGIGMAAGFFNLVRETSSFRGIQMRQDVALVSFVLAIAISLASSLFSLRKVLILDPATVFRS